jgi:hypothetical protein
MSETPDLGKEPREEPGRPPVNPYQPYQPGPYGYGTSPTGVPMGPLFDHPQTTTVLILGILGFVLCQVCSPFAWVMGKRVLTEIDASGGRLGGRSTAQVGYVLGIVGSVILGLGVLLGLVYLVVVIGVLSSSA